MGGLCSMGRSPENTGISIIDVNLRTCHHGINSLLELHFVDYLNLLPVCCIFCSNFVCIPADSIVVH